MIVRKAEPAMERIMAAVSKVEPKTIEIKLRSNKIHIPTPMIAAPQH